MTNQEKKEWLGRYRPVMLQIESLNREREALYHKSLQSPVFSDMTKGTATGNMVQAIVEAVSRIDRQIARELERAAGIRDEIASAIETVQDPTLQQILKYRYIDGETWENIAVKMSYSYSRIHQLHNAILDGVQIPTEKMR